MVDAEDEELDVEFWLVGVEDAPSHCVTVGRPPHSCAEGRSSQESIEMECATESGLG